MMPAAGTYALVVACRRDVKLEVGRFGRLSFPQGLYVYAGSAMRSLPSRLARHARRKKRVHWHVDALTTSPVFLVLGAVAFPPGGPGECEIAARCRSMPGAALLHPGFGSSDHGCPGHLVHLGEGGSLEAVVAGLGALCGAASWHDLGTGAHPGEDSGDTEEFS